MRIISVIMFVCVIKLFSYSFLVDFKEDEIDDIHSRYKYMDVNGELTGIIKIKTEVEDLNFDTNMGIVKRFKNHDGDLLLFLSPDENTVTIKKTGYINLDYKLPARVYSGCLFILEIETDTPKDALVNFKSIYKVDILVDEKKIGTSPLEMYKMFSGKKNFKFKTGDRILYEKELDIKPGDNLLNLTLGTIDFKSLDKSKHTVQVDSSPIDIDDSNIIICSVGKHTVLLKNQNGNVLDKSEIEVFINSIAEYKYETTGIMFKSNDLPFNLYYGSVEIKQGSFFPVSDVEEFDLYLMDAYGYKFHEFKMKNTGFNQGKTFNFTKLRLPEENDYIAIIDGRKYKGESKSELYIVPKTQSVEIFKNDKRVFNENINFNIPSAHIELRYNKGRFFFWPIEIKSRNSVEIQIIDKR
jgi:hypothetical protein